MIPWLSFAATAVSPEAGWDFTADPAGWAAGGDTLQWEWGVPTDGPADAAAAWGTNLDGPYLHDTVDWIVGALPPTDTMAAPILEIEHWYAIEAGDVGQIWWSDTGAAWTVLEPAYGYPTPDGYSGNTGGWAVDWFVLPPAATGQVRLVLTADAAFASDGWYTRRVAIYDGDVVPPIITPVEVPVDTQQVGGPFPIELDVRDDGALADVTVTWRVDDGAEAVAAAVEGEPDRWAVALPGQTPGSVVSWYATADDGTQTTRWPASDWSSFRVYLAAPTDLVISADRLVGATVPLSWSAPVGPSTPTHYRVWAGDGMVLDGVEATSVEVPIDDQTPPLLAVSAVYPEGEGDRSAPIAFSAEIPSIEPLDPAVGYPGDVLFVAVRGTALYLADGVSEATLGEGVTVEAIEVWDVGSATLTISLADDAQAGPRALEVVGSWGASTFDDAFVVMDASDAPKIVSVEPPGLAQGAKAQVRFEAQPGFAGSVTVEESGALVVADAPRADGDAAVVVTIAVPGGTAPGVHTLVLDDGERLWSTSLEVLPFQARVQSSCATAEGPRGGWLAAAAFVILIRARPSRGAWLRGSRPRA